MREWVEGLMKVYGRETVRVIPCGFCSGSAGAYLVGLSLRFEFAEADTGGLPCGGGCDILLVGGFEA